MSRLACLWFWFCLCADACATTTVLYPRPESLADERSNYPLALLKLSLQKADANLVLAPSPVRMQQGRSLRSLAQGKLVDVLWTVTTREREAALLPIRIPIDRGLIGWRLLIIRQRDRQAFSAIDDAPGLAAMRAGQGHDWPDTDVLKAQNFTLSTSSAYENLFKMLALGHIDYFPRSVNEIWPEVDARRAMNFEVAPRIVLRYPQALYYFVNKDNTALATAIETGLRAALKDGSMMKLFVQHHGDAIARARLSERTVIEIANPTLPPATPLSDRALWFTPPPKGAR